MKSWITTRVKPLCSLTTKYSLAAGYFQHAGLIYLKSLQCDCCACKLCSSFSLWILFEEESWSRPCQNCLTLQLQLDEPSNWSHTNRGVVDVQVIIRQRSPSNQSLSKWLTHQNTSKCHVLVLSAYEERAKTEVNIVYSVRTRRVIAFADLLVLWADEYKSLVILKERIRYSSHHSVISDRPVHTHFYFTVRHPQLPIL